MLTLMFYWCSLHQHTGLFIVYQSLLWVTKVFSYMRESHKTEIYHPRLTENAHLIQAFCLFEIILNDYLQYIIIFNVQSL